MLFIYDKKNKGFSPSEETNFTSHEIMERKDIEKWVMQFPEVLGEELLIITNEYDKFDRTKERVDLIALDKDGKIVIVELKRDDSGKNVELQAIKYAAYCSTLTMDKIVTLREEYLVERITVNDEIKNEIIDFIENDDFEELDDKPRIILVAKEFQPEVTSAVLWLRKFGLDISCIKLTPYKVDNDRIGVVSSILIPLPEAKEFIIESEKKEILEKPLSRTKEEYLSFYQELAHRIKGKIPVSLSSPSVIYYYKIPTEIDRVHFEWAFHGSPRSSFGVELHFEIRNKEENKKLIKEFMQFKDEIEKATGEKVIFLEDWGKTNSRLYIEKNEGKMTEELKQWAVDKMVIFYKLLKPKLDKLK